METDFPTPLGMPPHPAVYTPYRAGFCGSRGAAPRACGGKADIPPLALPGSAGPAAPRRAHAAARRTFLRLPCLDPPAPPRRAARMRRQGGHSSACPAWIRRPRRAAPRGRGMPYTPLRPMRPPPHPCRRSAGPCARGPLGRAALRRPLPRHARVPAATFGASKSPVRTSPPPCTGTPIVRPACTGCIRGRRPAGMRPAPAPATPLVHAAAHKAAYDRLHLSPVHAQGARRLLVVGSANGREHSAHLLA